MMSSAWKLHCHETHLIFMSLMEWGLFDFLVRCAHYTDAADIQNVRYNDNNGLIIHYSIMIMYISYETILAVLLSSVLILFHFKIIGNQSFNLKLPQQLWAWQNSWPAILFIYSCVIFINNRVYKFELHLSSMTWLKYRSHEGGMRPFYSIKGTDLL